MSESYSIVVRRPGFADSYLAVGPDLPLARLTPGTLLDPGAPKPRLFGTPAEAERASAELFERRGPDHFVVVIVEPGEG